ncbi:hypothetical protein HD554DRAFT_2317619 [Boletus coccyginus]|nr:hypothetical protein HD554DRAFT_2317619 [Boletus coccyginus]
MGSWEDSLQDANAAIKLNPSSLDGHERMHAALLGIRRYTEAINAYINMLLVLEQSANPCPPLAKSRKKYVTPSQARATIRSAVKQTQQDAPLVVIYTKTGRLCDQHERLDEFEADPKFMELISSMTTRLDHARIREVVQEYFRYATFSHTWEGAEPLFHDVLHGSVHKLAESSTVLKLVMFCATVREAGFLWAWCDTCCINKADEVGAPRIPDLDVPMGVVSDSDLGALEWSLWNTRAWTLQEFFASRVVCFYTEDWKPYLPDESVYNHKELSAIMAEMARATGTDVDVLLSLRPGSDNVQQKLCLAATRVATKQEDMAYSLFGKVSDYNSCLPAGISVYREPATPYVPSPIEHDKMDGLVTKLRTSSKVVESAMMLYDRVVILPSPRLFSRRLSLSCIMFPLTGSLVPSGDSPQRVYHTAKSVFGTIEIKTTEDLSSLNNLVLVHPWLRCLLDPSLAFEGDTEPFSPVGEDGDPDTPFANSRPPSSPRPTARQAHQSVAASRASRTAFRRAAARSSILRRIQARCL